MYRAVPRKNRILRAVFWLRVSNSYEHPPGAPASAAGATQEMIMSGLPTHNLSEQKRCPMLRRKLGKPPILTKSQYCETGRSQ